MYILTDLDYIVQIDKMDNIEEVIYGDEYHYNFKIQDEHLLKSVTTYLKDEETNEVKEDFYVEDFGVIVDKSFDIKKLLPKGYIAVMTENRIFEVAKKENVIIVDDD